MTNQEFIQSEYLKTRYMKNLTDEEFMDRFNLVFENMCIIDDNGKISPDSIHNKERLFWFHHWIVICAEAELRTIYGNQIRNVFLTERTHNFLEKINIDKLKEIRASISNNNYLYKFGKKDYLIKTLNQGEIFLRPASYYSDPSLNPAIKDDELSRNYNLNPKYNNLNVDISIKNEKHYLRNGIYKKTIESDYYVYCLADSFEPRLFNDFEADSCLIIKNPREFLYRISNCLPRNIFDYSSSKVAYFDPLLDDPLESNLIFSKNFAYTYQNEFRIAFVPYEKNKLLESTMVNIGSLADFAEIVSIF